MYLARTRTYQPAIPIMVFEKTNTTHRIMKPVCILACYIGALFFTIGNTNGQTVLNIETGGSGVLKNHPDTSGFLDIINYTQVFNTDSDTAANLYKKFLRNRREKGFAYSVVVTALDLSHICANKGKYRQGLELLLHALPYCQQSEAAKNMSPLVYNNIGNMYLLQGEYKQATGYYYQAILFAENNPSSTGIEYAYTNLVGIFNLYNKLPEALEYLGKAEKIAYRQKDQDLIESILINKGIIYMRLKKWSQAKQQFETAIDRADKYDRPHLKLLASRHLADLYLATGESSKAIPYIEEINFKENSTIPYYERVFAMITLGETYMAQHRYQEAERVLQEAIRISAEGNMTAKTIAIHEILGNLYAAMGNYQKAFRHSVMVSSQLNKFKNVQTAENLNQLDVKYRTAEKDKELYQKQLLIAQQQRSIEQKNTWIIGITSVILISALLMTGIYRNNRHKQQINQLKAMMTGEEKERARIARDLHDGIGGMLASLKMHFSALPGNHKDLDKAADYKETLQILDETASEVRMTAHNLMPELLLRYGFNEAMRIFCGKAGKGQDLTIDFQCLGTEGKLDNNTELSLYRMLQELVQNIVKHAEATAALVQVNLQGKTIDIMVEDNGKGMPPGIQRNGMGLASLEQRVRTMRGTFDTESSPGKGTTVYLQFDLDKIKTS